MERGLGAVRESHSDDVSFITLKRPLIKGGLSGPWVSICPAPEEDLGALSPPLPGVLPSDVADFLPPVPAPAPAPVPVPAPGPVPGPECIVRMDPADDPKGLPCLLLCLECRGDGFLPPSDADDDDADADATPVGVELKSYNLTDFSLSGAVEVPVILDLSFAVGHDFNVFGNISLDHVLPLCSSALTSACLNTRIGSLDTLLGILGFTVRY